jgi:hypothetical protein
MADVPGGGAFKTLSISRIFIVPWSGGKYKSLRSVWLPLVSFPKAKVHVRRS